MGSKDRWPGMSGRVEFGFHCLCNFSQAVPWKKLATKSSQGEARPSAKLIKLNPNKTPCFVLGFEQTKIGIKNPYLSNKKTHREWLTGVFFLTPKKSIPRRRRVDVVGPDVWCVTWLSRRERYLIQQSILGALEVSRFSNLLPRYSTLEEPPEDTMGWRTHPKKFGGKPDDLIFLGGLVGFGFVAGKKKWEGFKLTEDIFFFGTKLFLSFLWQMGSFLKNKCVV